MQKVYRIHNGGNGLSQATFKTIKDAVLEAKKRAGTNRMTYLVVSVEAQVIPEVIQTVNLKVDYAEEPTCTSRRDGQ